jgi:hypothetical protein
VIIDDVRVFSEQVNVMVVLDRDREVITVIVWITHLPVRIAPPVRDRHDNNCVLVAFMLFV